MPPKATCSFCGQTATLEASPAIAVCWSCAKRVARLVDEREVETLEESWSSVVSALGHVEPKPVLRSEMDDDRIFQEFKEGVEAAIRKRWCKRAEPRSGVDLPGVVPRPPVADTRRCDEWDKQRRGRLAA